MAVDQNSAPKDLRPLNPARNPLPPAETLHFLPPAAEPSALGFPAPHPPRSHPASDDPPDARKVKFLCSYGGEIIPRPSDGTLRYVGGQTRIVSARRDAALPEIMHKMAEVFGGPVAFRYQLPDVGLEALVSVSSSEDLDNMMEEYDKIAEAAPDGSAKLRAFLFSPSDLATAAAAADTSTNVKLDGTSQRYVDAVNGKPSEGSLRRKDSLVSAWSTQNSDVPQIGADAVTGGINEGTSPAIPLASHDPSRLLSVRAPMATCLPDKLNLPANPPAMPLPTMGSTIPAQTVNSSRPGTPHSAPYAPQVYVDQNQIQYKPPQLSSTGSLPVNAVAVPSHLYIPPGTPMVSQVGIMKPISAKMDQNLEENAFGGRIAQLHSDPNYKAACQPLLQLPPLPPTYLQSQNVEQYGLHTAAPPKSQGQTLRREDCFMCQKALPHAHSDTLILEHGFGSAVPEANTVFHSLHSEDATRLRAMQKVVTGPLVESMVRPKNESMVAAGQFGAYGLTQNPKTFHDNERLVLLNTENFDHGKFLHPPGPMSLPSDAQASYGMPVSMPQSQLEDSLQQQLPKSLGQPQFVVKPDLIAKPAGNDVYQVQCVNVQAAEPLNEDSVLDSSYDHVRQIDGMMEALRVSQLEKGFSERWKPVIPPNLGVLKELKPENPPLVVENGNSARPQVGGNTMIMGNAFTNTEIAPEGNYFGSTDQLPPSSLSFAQLHTVQAAVSSQVSTPGAYLVSQETGDEPMFSSEQLHGMPSYSFNIDPSYNNNTINKILVEGWNDEASQCPKYVLNDLAAPPSANVSFPFPNSIVTTGHMEQFQELVPSDSLCCNQDPRKILGNTNLLHPRPAGVANKESVIIKDLSTDRGSNIDEASQFKYVLDDLAAPPNVNVSFPLPNSIATTGHVEQFQEPVPSGSVFCNHDSRNILGNMNLLPPRPARVANKESVIVNDLSSDRVSNIDEPSQYPKYVLKNLAAPPSATGLCPLLNSIVTTGHVEQFQEPVPSGSLFCNQDPSKILGNTSLLPPRPAGVANKESVIVKDVSTDRGSNIDEASQYPKYVLNDLAAPPSANVSFPLPNSIVTTGHMEQFQEPVPPGSLFCNQDPRKILGNTNLLPPRPAGVTNKESVIVKDSSTAKDSDIAVLLEEGVFRQPPNSLNKDSCPEAHIRATRGLAEDQTKQELQAVAEGVAPLVLQSYVPPVPIFISRESKDPILQSNKEKVIIEDSASSQSDAAQGEHRIEDIETKQLDKMNLGFPIGDDIGRLQIIKNSDLEELRELGSGTFGTVYHGKWRGSDVAIKRINDRCFVGKHPEQERMWADIRNEACKLADLHHPNVVAFYGVVLDGPEGSIATVTEYMVNGSLRHVLQKNHKTLDRCKRLLIAMDVAFGMEYLHGKNMVHFDLKSDNLLVNLRDPQRPICKVGDLGLSKLKCQTLFSGGVRGTLAWMAPELLNGSSSLVSDKVDVFSFGIVMWELLTGEEPYADLHYGTVIGGIVNNTLRPLVPESCDPEWRWLMEKCWSSEPSERPSFTEIAGSLRAMADSPTKRSHEQLTVQSQPQR